MQEINDFYLERMVRLRQADLRAEADRERAAWKLTAHHLRFPWVRRVVSVLKCQLAGLAAPNVAREPMDP